MIPELGHFALIVALCLALIQGLFPIVGAQTGNRTWMALAKPAAHGQFLFILLAFACLTYAFVKNDFSVQYVAQHSNSQLPLLYRISGVWGGHEGSLLLWMLMLTGWTVAVAIFSRQLPQDHLARVIGVLGLVAVGFLLFVLFTSNPFTRLLPAAPDGRDLNPLLQDPGLVIHPPMLYMGYVGFSVAFAFAIAALLGGKLDATWARWSRPWTTVAWAFLTVGIALGSWWAYYELGWGGWWFWDPVENASFMPWLVGTALIHSLAVTEKRGSFKSWTVLLAIAAFSLSLLGTFLVRSGVLTSVHSFASDPTRGVFILAFLVVVVGSSLLLYAFRAPKIGLGGSFDLVSRETMLLGNNVLMVVAAGSVLLGTLFPLILDALVAMKLLEPGNKISVGPPYFNAIFLPLMVPAVFLMAIGPIARWKKASLPELAVRLRWAFLAGLATALVLPWILGKWTPLISLGLLLAFWVMFAMIVSTRHRLRHAAGATLGARVAAQPKSYWGMQLAHFGVAIFVLGVTMVKGYEVEKDLAMKVGDTAHVAGYVFRFDGVMQTLGPNYQADRGVIAVANEDNELVAMMHPEKRIYNSQPTPMTEAAIDLHFFNDLYVSLGDPLGDTGAWAVRIYYKPFVSWIWGGCALMALGGLLAVTDKRYRLLSRKSKRIENEAGGAPVLTPAGATLGRAEAHS